MAQSNSTLRETEAISVVHDIKKLLIPKGIWYTISEVHEDALKFVKLEISIKVKS